MSLFDESLLNLANAPVAPVAPLFAGLGDDAWLEASHSLDADVHPVGMLRPFLPWQSAAYLYCQQAIVRWGGVLVADDMGMGKTQVALALANDALIAARAAGDANPYVIVIAPTVAQAGYQSDLRAAFPNIKMHVVKGRTEKALAKPLPAADVYFISDDPLTLKAWMAVETKLNNGKLHTVAKAWPTNAQMIVRDEIHRDKGNMGKPAVRSRVMLAVGEAVRRAGRAMVGMTGTLLTNGRPVEAYLPLQIVAGERVLMALTPGSSKGRDYLWKYCNPKQVHIGQGRYITDYSGMDVRTAEVLHENLRRTLYVRREKGDLPGDVLPHCGWQITPLALDDDTMRRYTRVAKDFLNLIMDEQGAEAMWRAQRAEALRQLMMLWEEAGIAKAEAAVDYISTLVEEGEQVVAFYQHTEVLTKMMKALAKAKITYTVISGSVTGDARTDAVESFQAGDYQVVLAQIQAAGQSVTFTAACHAVFVQVPWASGQIAQCAGRILRVDDITRDRAANGGKVTWHVLQACYDDGEQTFDSHIWGVLEKKALIMDVVNCGREITMPDDMIYREAMMSWQPDAKRHGGW